jgi:hypothetical protein
MNPSETWEHHAHPFNTFPPLRCHISPPLAVANAGPKLSRFNLEDIALAYHNQERNEPQKKTLERLTVLRDIWDLIEGAKGLAKSWAEEQGRNKRKRDPDDDDDDMRSQRSVRSAMKSSQCDSPTCQHNGETQARENLGMHKRNWEMMDSSTTTLTGVALARLESEKRQKTDDWIKTWVESTSNDIIPCLNLAPSQGRMPAPLDHLSHPSFDEVRRKEQIR